MHKSVLLEESIYYLNLKKDSVVVDCTLGYAGHSSKILSEIKDGLLVAFDQDTTAIEYSNNLLKEISNNYKIIKSNFVNIKKELNDIGIKEVDGILYDLGVSSPQLDEADRGFSFHQDARLDMRMDISNPLDAYKVVNEYPYEKLVKIFKDYGEEKYSSKIASGIIKKRPIETTLELVEVIKENVPEKYKREHHPARRIFQAIRIEVNDELNVFEKSLKDSLDLIKVGGRVCVITFHSLEDKICKKIFKNVSEVSLELKKLPIIPDNLKPKYKIVKVLLPKEEEIDSNNRARSAKLRVIERVG